MDIRGRNSTGKAMRRVAVEEYDGRYLAGYASRGFFGLVAAMYGYCEGGGTVKIVEVGGEYTRHAVDLVSTAVN